jgi:cytochrome P450
MPYEDASLATWAMRITLLVPLLFLARIVYNLYFHPLAHIPGPFWGRASGIPSWYHSFRGDRHIWLWQQFEMHGDTIRAEPNLIVYRDPKAYSDIYGVKANVQRSRFYLSWKRQENAANTMTSVDYHEHAWRRKILNQAFTENMVRTTSEFMIQHIERWNELMLDECADGDEWSATINLADRLDMLIFDIMGDLVFGTDFKIKEPGENQFRIMPHTIASYLKFLYPISRSPILEVILWLKPRGLNQLMEHTVPPAVRQYYKFVEKCVNARIDLFDEEAKKPEDERRKDMFYYVRDARNPETGEHALEYPKLRAESAMLTVAGTDTTAVSLTGIFFYLSSDPWRSQKLFNELRETFSTVDEIVYGPKLNGCTYLRACIDEGMRLFPSGPSEAPREVRKGGLTVMGEHLPEGTVVGIVGWCISRHEGLFPDANIFRPERWIVDESANNTKEDVARIKTNFHPFLSGATGCVGKNVAMTEMMLVVARTFYRFEFRRTPGSTLGCGRPELGWGARDGKQMQVSDAYISLRNGPELQFRRRRL